MSKYDLDVMDKEKRDGIPHNGHRMLSAEPMSQSDWDVMDEDKAAGGSTCGSGVK